MRNTWLLGIAVLGVLACAPGGHAESAHRLGVGVNYWEMVDDINAKNIDEDGFSWLVTYQRKVGELLKLELDLEIFESGFQGIPDTVYAPEACLVLGSTIYAAAAVGILYHDGDFADDPFYALRAGVDLEIVPRFYLDVNANYRFIEWTNPGDIVGDIDGDTIMLGAALRVEL